MARLRPIRPSVARDEAVPVEFYSRGSESPVWLEPDAAYAFMGRHGLSFTDVDASWWDAGPAVRRQLALREWCRKHDRNPPDGVPVDNQAERLERVRVSAPPGAK